MATKTKTSAGKETVSQTVARAKKLLGGAYDSKTKAPSSKRVDEIANQKFVSSSVRDNYNKSKTTVITPERLERAEVVEVPTVINPPAVGDIASAGNVGLASMLSGMGYSQDENGLFMAPKEDAGTSSDLSGQANAFQNYLQQTLGNAPVNQEDIYNKSPERKEVNRAQRDVNQYTSQLNAITASSQAEQLKLEGQGRGQTQGFIGGEQARINREAAIAALPVQAQLSAAQGNLEFAQKQLETLFTLRVADAKAKYDYNSNLISSVYNFASTIDQARLNALKTKEDRAFTLQQQSIVDAKNIAMQAIEYGQSSLAARIMELDPKSATYQQEVNAALGQLRKPVAAVAAKAPDLQNFGTADNPQWRQYDPTTGKWKEVDGLTNQQAVAEAEKQQAIAETLQTKVSNVEGLKKHPGLNSAVGPIGLLRVGVIDAFGAKDEFVGKVEQLISQEFLDSLINAKAKGATFGALTKPEQDALTASATAIGQWRVYDDKGKVVGYDIDEASMKEELNNLISTAQKAESRAMGYDVTLVPPGDSILINRLVQEANAISTMSNFNPANHY